MQAHLQQSMDSIAIMKCIGARSSQIMRIYLLQTIALGLAGGLLGVAFGLVVQRVSRRFSPATSNWSRPRIGFRDRRARHGIGILASLLFTLPPLLGIRRHPSRPDLPPRNGETRPDWRTRLARRARRS